MSPRRLIKRLVSKEKKREEAPQRSTEEQKVSDEERVEAIRNKLEGYQPPKSQSLFVDDYGSAPLRKPIREPRKSRRR